MQFAILLVLILIAVILAPSLLGVIAALIVAYGFWPVVTASLTFAVTVLFLLIYALNKGFFSRKAGRSAIDQQIAEANKQHRANEAAKRAISSNRESLIDTQAERVVKKKMGACKNCKASIEKYSMYCPKCGKSPV